LIIGGGITGAGIALDAASRGLKTALVEKVDFAYGTSSRSTKLIHGGLRYLKQLEFGLVKEVGSERAVVHNIAPHLVVPEKMLLPLYEKRGFGSILTSFGLKLYDFLAGVKEEDQRKMLTRSQTLKQEPLLEPNDIKGGAIYAEYRTDDARLTIEIIKTASTKSAVIANYCEVIDFIYENGKVKGVVVLDRLSNQKYEVKAKVIVNATGPWVDSVREINNSKKGKRLHLTKGVHIVLPFDKLSVKQAIYFDVGDGRMIFAIPRGRTTYVGTTDTNYYENLDEVVATREDAEYIIEAINRTFHNVNLSLDDIESSWAGLRPLIHEEGKSASELSRKDEIFESESGLISIAGGKLTGYRKMAERIVDLVMDKFFENQFLECKTDEIQLTGSDFKNTNDVKEYIALVAHQLRSFGVEESANYLVSTYGKQASDILHTMDSINQEDFQLRLLLAELNFSIKNEMVIKPSDFLVRRSGLLFFNRLLLDKYLIPILLEFKKLFHWDESVYENERTTMIELITNAHYFK
jgi:glycerol-3-phosphate dehydrogenase